MSNNLKSSVSGYGLVFKRVMKDRNISIEAKALYSYLSAYAGTDESSFPSVGLIKHELGIGKHRFLRAKNELINNGYLTVDRKQTKNIYGSNLYTLFHSPRQANGRPVDDRPAYDRPVDSQPTTNNSITSNSITSNSKTINNSATDVTREQFEEWWQLYDKKLDKKKAASLFKSALKKHDFETIMKGTREYLKTITNKQYQKYPKTFLGQESYLNDFTQETVPNGLDQLERMKYDESYWD
ncbi:helix-turn-helix domain-containing protein [Staphylococcus epidermidis]|uniref:helix-turn-helix domain-containing protein n=1 Tax=Staphylococcus epidermidis TaxID=1282 RepID=UPI001E45BD7F|nr:helix-turn-helix domain-containing protein [Staphylococcus epidermidis]MCD8869766.1 helix-turn-helix domain-containing protein [Staphylococcus epidermidis]MEB6250457.1 helix-turn-helix domain-containing protein [Staphylococcus epidermidis]